MSFIPLTGGGIGGAYQPGDKWGYQTAEKVRGDFNDHETRIGDLETALPPNDATYIVQTPSGDLSGEQALSLLSTGIVKVTTSTGVLSSVSAPSGAIVGTSDAQTLTNKTVALGSNTITGNLALANLPSNFAQIFKPLAITLTNAQTKALPTTPITLISAPGSGFATIPFMASVYSKTSSGAYTNIDGDGFLTIRYASNIVAMAIVPNDPLITNGSSTRLSDFLGTTTNRHVQLVPISETEGVDEFGDVAHVRDTADIANQALVITIDNNGAGDLTGGHAANSLVVNLYYAVEAVP